MPKKPSNMFTSYDEALADLYPRLESHHVLRQSLSFMPVTGGVSVKQIDSSHARDIIKWFSRTADLPRPWPAEYQEKLFEPRTYLPPNAQSLVMADKSASKRPLVSPLRWYFIDDVPLRRRLARVLVRDIGVPPHRFLPQINATLLGAAAYTNNIPVLKVMLDYTSPPESRLLTLPHHLKENASHWLFESTLLHRVIQRYSGIVGGDGQDLSAVTSTVDLLSKHDPECLLCRNSDGHLPEEMDPTGDVGKRVEMTRKHYTSSQRHRGLSKIAGDKRSLPKDKLLPKI